MATPFTAEDVKFSFLRYKGAKQLRDKVREVEIVDSYRIRFHLHTPWPDFMAYYGTLATGAAWIVPKKYVEHVGDDGFKKHPIGLGPYKFVSHTAWHRAGYGGVRGLLAQSPARQTVGLQKRPGSRHTHGHAEEGGSGYRLPPGGAARRGSSEATRIHPSHWAKGAA